MDTLTIINEIKSPALKEVVKDLCSIVERVKDGIVAYQQGSVEITGCKHVIQALALDWAFNRRIGIHQKLIEKKDKCRNVK